MRKLAVAQLGSLGKLDSTKFVQNLAEQTIRRLLPPVLRQIGLNDAAERCEREGTREAANAARNAASLAAYAAHNASNATVEAARDDAARDGVLTLMCDICVDVLREMKAPGIALMDQVC